MSDQPNKKLDQLFQHGSEQYDFEYNPEAWQQIEGVLKKENRRRRFAWWWWRGISAIMLLLLIWFFGKNEASQTSDHTPIENTTSKTSSNEVEKITTQDFTPKQNKTLLDTNTINYSKILNTKTEDLTKHQNLHLKTTKNIKQPFFQTSNQLSNQKDHFNNPIPNPSENNFSALGNSSPVRADQTNLNVVKSNAIKNNIFTKEENSILLSSLPLAWTGILPQKNKSTYQSTLLANSLEYSNGLKNNWKNSFDPPQDKQWVIGLLIANELYSVAQRTNSSNFKFGSLLEYRFNEKFSLNTGISFVRKIYQTVPGAYAPPVGFWVNGIAPKSIAAECDILEIPLKFGYYKSGYARSGVFLNGGLTSYLMLEEQYQYSYNSVDPELIPEWVGRNKNQHWFSILEMEAGFQKVFNRTFSLQLASNLQFPLTGIGHGKVKIYSTGLHLKGLFRIK